MCPHPTTNSHQHRTHHTHQHSATRTSTTRNGGTHQARSARSANATMSTPTVGDLHITVREAFKRRGWGASTLANIAKDYPSLMNKPATKENMARLVAIENQRAKNGKKKTRGDHLARAANPVRGPVVHWVGANAAAGANGHVRGAFGNGGRGYGEELRERLRDMHSNH
ncbi:hypothetical protein [Agarilytica rhodophyticola]|uniref:hypothetical protein n=1 Tax=Agarilytica rhodophyticola TaxID=1737490 RepID=UPI000B341F77|nr:hypothetical protein [Agarilytica rhodophyticola]